MKNKPTHGGSREGAGAKPKGEECRKRMISLRLPPDLIARLKESGKSQAEQIEAALRGWYNWSNKMKIEAKINHGEINLFVGGGYVDCAAGNTVDDAKNMIEGYAENSGAINLEGADIYIDGESWTINDGYWIECDDDGFPRNR